MDVINKTHPEIQPGHSEFWKRSSAYLRSSGNEIYLNAIASRSFGLKQGDAVEFIRDVGEQGDTIFFMVLSTEKDSIGFNLSWKNKKSLRIVNKSLVKLLNRGLKIKYYSLEKVQETYGGKNLIKLISINP